MRSESRGILSPVQAVLQGVLGLQAVDNAFGVRIINSAQPHRVGTKAGTMSGSMNRFFALILPLVLGATLRMMPREPLQPLGFSLLSSIASVFDSTDAPKGTHSYDPWGKVLGTIGPRWTRKRNAVARRRLQTPMESERPT